MARKEKSRIVKPLRGFETPKWIYCEHKRCPEKLEARINERQVCRFLLKSDIPSDALCKRAKRRQIQKRRKATTQAEKRRKNVRKKKVEKQ
jgi:hypothetical protein